MAQQGGWPIETVGVSSLRLDTDNVRIRGVVAGETATMNYLYAEEDVAVLAHDILRNGYIDNELPVVVRHDGQLVVLEGNRRIAALKGLNDPEAVPSRTPQLLRLQSRYGVEGVPTEIRVMVAPSMAAAAPLLARLHTKNPKKAWPPDQQAKFYHSQLSASVTVDDLKQLYPSEAGKIPRFIRMAEMRELAHGIRYRDKAVRQFVLDDELTMSAFEYAHGKPAIREVAGLAFTADGLLVDRKLSQAHARVLEHILAGFKSGVLNTRSPQLQTSKPEHAAYVAELQAVAEAATDRESNAPNAPGAEPSAVPGPNPSRAGSGRASGTGPGTSGGTDGSKTGGGGEPAPDPTSRGPNRGHTAAKLNLLGIAYAGSSAGIRRRLEELRIINVKDVPNAAYYLLRSLLECSIKQFFRRANSPLPPGTTLVPAVEQLSRHFASDKRLTAIINSLKQGGRLNADQFLQSAGALNVLLHEPDAFVTAEEVHHAWERMAPLVRQLLDESGVTPTPAP